MAIGLAIAGGIAAAGAVAGAVSKNKNAKKQLKQQKALTDIQKNANAELMDRSYKKSKGYV